MKNVVIKFKILLNMTGLRRKKIFAIGFNKSATSSLHTLFNEINRPAYHGVDWRDLTNLKLLNKYDCFSDGTPKDIAKLDSLFPNAKYILQVRDLRSWIYSRLAHIDRYKNQDGYRTNEHWDVSETSIKYWIIERNEYHKKVFNYFKDRPQDLIVVNFIRDNEAATKVCNFLGYSGNWDKPEKNVNPSSYINPDYESMLKNSIASIGIQEVELSYDILCPSLVKDEAGILYDTRQLS